MTLDLMFLARNRMDYTRESLRQIRQNTNWALVAKIVIYDDGSTDGTLEFLRGQALEMGAELRQTRFGSGIAAKNDFIKRSTAEMVATVDNDAMYPPGWLDLSIGVMERHPELQILCLENYQNLKGDLPHSYQRETFGDGLFVARRDCFRGSLPIPVGTYFGLQAWIKQNEVVVGWIKPSIPVFLLDRVPAEPWRSLAAEYETAGWQRPLTGVRPYTDQDAHLWGWCGWSGGPQL